MNLTSAFETGAEGEKVGLLGSRREGVTREEARLSSHP